MLLDDNSELLYDLYTFEGRAGQRIVIELTSPDFDAYLAFGPIYGGTVDVTDTDDDGASGTDSRLRVVLPANGRYGIHARAFGEGGMGAYTIRVTEVAAPTPKPITAGQPVTAVLEDAEAEWVYRGQAGERLVITLQSDEFDTVLVLGRMEAGRFVQIAENDDDDDSTNSRLIHTLTAPGEYVVRAQSFGSSGGGRYTLRVESARR
jgi:hypothetical protein